MSKLRSWKFFASNQVIGETYIAAQHHYRVSKADASQALLRAQLSELIGTGAEIFASNQVIGETYIAAQHHYRVSKADASQALLRALSSGLVAPLNGSTVIEALTAVGGPGLFDRLITDDYTRASLEVLTLDRKMATLSNVQSL